SVIDAPKGETVAPKTAETHKGENSILKLSVKPSASVVKPDGNSGLLNISVSKITAKKDGSINETSKAKSQKSGGNIMLEIGEKLKNKTLEVGEKMKNKTIEKLKQIGENVGVLKPKTEAKKLLFVPLIWPLNLSLTDVGDVMKDTDHLKKQENISVDYPKLVSMKTNVTEGNSTIALRKVVMANRVGFCDCEDYDCTCCARVTHKRIHMNATACSNVTFMTKSQELEFRFAMDFKPLYKAVIPVEKTPQICLGSTTKVADLCIRFLNLTSSVNVQDEHKFRVIGCLEYSISLFNKTVSAFPVDCFEIPSHQHHQESHKENFPFINFVP
ncbi:hypothetical protein FSP39_009182, partial [Pinctada imbricata]